MALKVCFLGAVRRKTLICCRNIQSSTWSAARDRNRSATIQTMSLTRSLITQQHRPILDQLLVVLFSSHNNQTQVGTKKAADISVTLRYPECRALAITSRDSTDDHNTRMRGEQPAGTENHNRRE